MKYTESALLIELLLPKLQPGEYEFEFFVIRKDSEIVAAAKKTFRVKTYSI